MSRATDATAATGLFRKRYETLRSLLNRNGRVLQILSDLEGDLRHLRSSDYRLRRPIERLCDETLLMAQELNLMADHRYQELYQIIEQIRWRLRESFVHPSLAEDKPLAVRLGDERSVDGNLVGGKAAGIAGIRDIAGSAVPDGFVITTAAYDQFLAENELDHRIRLMLKDIEVTADRDQFSVRIAAIRQMMMDAAVPEEIVAAIHQMARQTAGVGPTGWAARSSANAEDGPFTFAGQFDSLLNVEAEALEEAYRAVLAGRFTDRAVSYRLNCGFREKDTPMAVLFMPMIQPTAAGVIYTADPEAPTAERMLVSCVPGLGKDLVQGRVPGDLFRLSRQAHPELLPAQAEHEPAADPALPSYLTLEQLQRVGALGYQTAEALGCPMDIEWAIDAGDKLWLLQGRRLTLASKEVAGDLERRHRLPVLEGGR